MTAMQRQQTFNLAIVRALAAESPDAGWLLQPYPSSSLSGPVRNRTRRLSDDPATGLGRASAAGNDVDRASLHGDEHPGIPSGPATVASPPPGGGRHVLQERAA